MYKRQGESYPSYLPFFKLNDHVLLLKKSRNDFLTSLAFGVRLNIARLINSDFNILNESRYNKEMINGGSITDMEVAINKSQYCYKYPSYTLENYTESYNIQYLKRIIEHCRSKKKPVFFVRSPQHANWPFLENEKNFQAILKTKFPGVEFLDFNDFPIKNTEFADLNHLNPAGAEIFSNWFNFLLKEGLLASENKQQFIQARVNTVLD